MQSRQSRMDKYYEKNADVSSEETAVLKQSRTKRNQELYKEVSNLEIENFDLNSNVSVIGENTDNISLDEIKDILSEKYRENPRKKSFGDTDEIALPKINLDETREYDINSILEKAKEKKEVNYEEDRLKKVRNSDILKDLDIMNNEEEIEEKDDLEEKPTDRRETPEKEKEEKQLLDLINTITAKELIDNEKNLEVTGELDPLDILSDLRGDDENTRVMGALVQDVIDEENQNEDTLEIRTDEIASDLTVEINFTIENEVIEDDFHKEIEEQAKQKEKKKDNKLEDSFVTNIAPFTQSDFDDFKDLKDDMKFTKIIIRILLFIIIVAFIVGCVVLANKYLGLGLF